MTKRNTLLNMLAIPLALAGCENRVSTVRFGEYTFSKEAFELMAGTQTAGSKPYNFEDYTEEGRHYDRNNDKFLSHEEMRAGLKKGIADVAAMK